MGYAHAASRPDLYGGAFSRCRCLAGQSLAVGRRREGCCALD
ncbi:MAG: hypothetical protein ACYS67_09045 [Planctomycetota bacterium]